VQTTFTKKADGEFEIVIDSKEPVLFRIKLAYFPGVELVGDNQRLPLYEGMSGMIGYGRGRMELRYGRASGVSFGYAVSLVTAVLLIALLIRNRRRRSEQAVVTRS
jgi:hypothetical protein